MGGAGGEHYLWRGKRGEGVSGGFRRERKWERRRRSKRFMHAGGGNEMDEMDGNFCKIETPRTESAPCLFFQGIQRGNLVASSVATASDVSTASKSGVSQLAFLLMQSSS